MSRPATAARRAAHAGRATPRPLRPVPRPRRVSGPSSTRPAAATAAPGILVGAAGLARTLPDSRALDRLIRGRTWVAVIAVALIGIVAMQVHMLGLNAGIGRAVEKATTLEQENTSLRLEVSRLGSGERIAREAQQLGLVMPNAGEVRYTDVHPTDATRAAKTMKPADPDLAAQAKAAVEAGVGTGAIALAPESAEKAPGATPAPAAVDPAATAQAPAAATPTEQQQQQQPQQPAVAQETQAQPQTQTQQPATQEQAPVQAQQQQQPVQPQAPATQPQQQSAGTVTPSGGAVATPGG
jgi:cell division protein FtsL